MIKELYQAFLNWRGDKEVYNLGVAYKKEIYRVKNWKFKDYYNNEVKKTKR